MQDQINTSQINFALQRFKNRPKIVNEEKYDIIISFELTK